MARIRNWENPILAWSRYLKRHPVSRGFLLLGLGVGLLTSWLLVRNGDVSAAEPALTTFGIGFLLMGILYCLREPRE